MLLVAGTVSVVVAAMSYDVVGDGGGVSVPKLGDIALVPVSS